MTTAMETLNCGQCGAPLRVPETAQFVTCNHCRSSLAIRRMESITLTEQLQQTEGKLGQIESHLAQLVYENRFAEENRRWEREQHRHQRMDQSGNILIPSLAFGCIPFAICTVIAVVIFSSGGGAFALLPLAFGCIPMIAAYYAVNQYQRDYKRHLQRLSEIPKPSADSPSTENLLAELEHAPTPEDYLRELSANES